MTQQIVNLLTLGSVYALFALGYSMVYGILTMLNFAHGEVFMIGGFVAFMVQQLFLEGDQLTANPVVVILCMLVAAMAGLRRSRRRHRVLRLPSVAERRPSGAAHQRACDVHPAAERRGRPHRLPGPSHPHRSAAAQQLGHHRSAT